MALEGCGLLTDVLVQATAMGRLAQLVQCLLEQTASLAHGASVVWLLLLHILVSLAKLIPIQPAVLTATRFHPSRIVLHQLTFFLWLSPPVQTWNQ